MAEEMNVMVEASSDIEAQQIERIEAGELFENVEDLSPGYREALKQVIHIAAISEVTVLTWAHTLPLTPICIVERPSDVGVPGLTDQFS